MLKLKQTKWCVLSLLAAVVLPGSIAHASSIDLGQVPTAPTAEPAPISPAQRPISETKRLLIDQLLELTGGEQMYEQTQQAIFAQTQQQVQALIGQRIENQENLSPAEAAEINSRINALFARVSEAMQTVTYDEILEQVYYPVYDQYFTEEDLQGLIEFYQTPLGAKLVTVSPELIQTTTELSSEIYLPRVFEVIDEVLQEQPD